MSTDKSRTVHFNLGQLKVLQNSFQRCKTPVMRVKKYNQEAKNKENEKRKARFAQKEAKRQRKVEKREGIIPDSVIDGISDMNAKYLRSTRNEK